MEKLETKKLYVVRPMKLIKHVENVKLEFPYNVAVKLGLMQEDGSCFKFGSQKFQRQVYNTARYNREEVFDSFSKDITIAKKEKSLTKFFYQDIFSNNKFKLYWPYAPYENSSTISLAQKEAVVIDKYINNLWESFKEVGENLPDELSLKELEYLKQALVKYSSDFQITFTHERPNQLYRDNVSFGSFAYDKNGFKQEPKITNKVKIKEKNFN